MRVLVVDDTDAIRMLLRELLEMHDGIEIVGEANNGRVGVELARELQPDVVVMDYMMPMMTGPDATKQIKTQFPHMRVVAFSSADDRATRDAFIEAGVDAHKDKVDIVNLIDLLVDWARDTKA